MTFPYPVTPIVNNGFLDVGAEAMPHAEQYLCDAEGHGGPQMSAWIAERAESLL